MNEKTKYFKAIRLLEWYCGGLFIISLMIATYTTIGYWVLIPSILFTLYVRLVKWYINNRFDDLVKYMNRKKGIKTEEPIKPKKKKRLIVNNYIKHNKQKSIYEK